MGYGSLTLWRGSSRGQHAWNKLSLELAFSLIFNGRRTKNTRRMNNQTTLLCKHILTRRPGSKHQMLATVVVLPTSPSKECSLSSVLYDAWLSEVAISLHFKGYEQDFGMFASHYLIGDGAVLSKPPLTSYQLSARSLCICVQLVCCWNSAIPVMFIELQNETSVV